MNIMKEIPLKKLVDNKMSGILRLTMLFILFFILMLNLVLIVFWVPSMGSSSGKEAARILYLHVPLAWGGFLAFLFVYPLHM